MEIELRKVKHLKMASEETACFEAQVWIDGRNEGVVSNSGTGGANRYHPHEIESRIEAFAKTLPCIACDFLDDDTGEPHMMAQSAESLIGDLFFDWELRKDWNRAIKSRLVFICADGNIYQSGKYTSDEINKFVAGGEKTVKSLKAVILLNAVPDEEGFAAYKKAIKA